MSEEFRTTILPYSYVVGQERLKLALDLSYISPGVGGVLISGQRGTAKSTAVRAFCVMMYDALPVTLPLNATDDRVVGGWSLDDLMRGDPVRKPGLLEDAGERGLLYIDEVNLLDDHLINIILDVSSTGVLTVQREALDETIRVDFFLVGTMNPDEGLLRPQLVDRFGLMVQVEDETTTERRLEIMRTVLLMDKARHSGGSEWLDAGRGADQEHRDLLEDARSRLYEVSNERVLQLCAEISAAFHPPGYRCDAVMAMAAQALAALEGSDEATAEHVAIVAQLALQHRRPVTGPGGQIQWTDDDTRLVETLAGKTSA